MTQTIDAPQRQPESPVQRGRAWLLRKETLGYLVLALFTVFLVAGSFVGPREESDLPPAEYRGGYVLTDREPTPLHRSAWAVDRRASELQPSATGTVLVWADAQGDYTLSWTRLRAQDPELAALRAQPQATAEGDPRDLMRRVAQIGFVLAGVTALTILFGPRPRVGTRWFWIFQLLVPLGIGAAWFAWTELVRTPHERRPRRRSGFDGFFTMVGLTIAITAGLWFVAGF